MQEFVQETRDFASEIKAVTRQKPIHYTLTFDSGKSLANLDFNLDCSCILNVKRKDCSNFVMETKNCRVKHMQSKITKEKQIEIAQAI